MYYLEPFEPKILVQYFRDQTYLENLIHPLCILGVPDLSNLGEISTKYLIKELNAEKILTYHISDFLPIGYVENQEGTFKLSYLDLYLIKDFHNSRDFIIITGNEAPLSPIGNHFVANMIADLLGSYNSELFISIASNPTSYSSLTPQLYFVSNFNELLQMFKLDEKTHQNKELSLQLLQKGLIAGVNALSVSYASTFYNIPGGILLSEVLESVEIDYTAVKAILKVLDAVLKLQLSFKALDLDAKKFQKNYPKEPLSENEALKNVRRRIQT